MLPCIVLCCVVLCCVASCCVVPFSRHVYSNSDFFKTLISKSFKDGGHVHCTVSKFQVFPSRFSFENVSNRAKIV